MTHARWMAQLAKRFCFDLANALAGDVVHFTDLFQSTFVAVNKAEAHFVATAHGDLDGDGVLSTFQITGESKRGAEPKVLPLDVHREVE